MDEGGLVDVLEVGGWSGDETFDLEGEGVAGWREIDVAAAAAAAREAAAGWRHVGLTGKEAAG